MHAAGFGSTVLALAGPNVTLQNGSTTRGDGGLVEATYRSTLAQDAGLIISRGAWLKNGAAWSGSGGLIRAHRVSLRLDTGAKLGEGVAAGSGGLASVSIADVKIS